MIPVSSLRRARAPRSRPVRLARAAGLFGASAAVLAACQFTSVAQPNPKAPGLTTADALAPELAQVVVAQGSMKLDGGTADIPYYGYLGDGPLLPAAGDLPSATHKVEASKTEPDKNTYLVLKGQSGADPTYNYGTHFLFQGHELGSPGYITRINLDADVAHRVTLLASKDTAGNNLPNFDGSTWDPYAKRLLFTAELGNKGGVWSSTLDGKTEDVSGVLGRGGYEGIQNDNLGNLYVVEDVGGVKGAINKNAKQPNSFVYRLVPVDKSDLSKGGKLQALQVQSLANPGQPISFHAGDADGDITSQDTRDLFTFGKTFATSWVTIHDTAVDGTTPFDSNALAKAKGATPMKRPENGVFQPGNGFKDFYFTVTGDTDNRTEAGAELGGYGGLFRLHQSAPGQDTGTLSLFYRGDQAHTGLDNIAFLDASQVIAVEDAGDTLHTQRNGLDSMYLFETGTDYGTSGASAPVRLLAQGRDPSATIDSGFSGQAGFQNEGDNEITGIHVSNGDPTPNGILGVLNPNPWLSGWRVFYTRQHGENVTYELMFDVRNQPGYTYLRG